MLTLIGMRAFMAGDRAAAAQAMRASGEYGRPRDDAGVDAHLGFGLVMCWFWVGFTDLWIVIGLAGYAATFLIGMLVFKPAGERMAAIVAKEGVTEAALAEGRRTLRFARLDYAVMVVVADMVLKPGAGDVAILGAMAAVAAVGGAVAAFMGRDEAMPAAVA